MEPYVNDLQPHIGDSDSKSIRGKCVAENLSYSVRRESGAQSQHLLTEGHTSFRGVFNRERYSQLRPNAIENTIPEPKIRKKNPTCFSLEPSANFPEEHREEIMKDRYQWKRYQQVSTEGPCFPSFSYKCTHPGCTMRMHTDRVSLHPDKLMVSYEGVHNHSDSQTLHGKSQKPVSCPDLQRFPCISVPQNKKLAAQKEIREDILQRLQSPSIHIVKLDQYIEHLKPNYGIFLKQPSKIKYGVLDDHVAESTASICVVSSSQDNYGEPHQTFYDDACNVCHAPLYSKSIHNPYHSQQLQQSNLNAGYYTFKSLTYERPSSSLIHPGVIDDAELLQWIHPSYVQLNGNWTEN